LPIKRKKKNIHIVILVCETVQSGIRLTLFRKNTEQVGTAVNSAPVLGIFRIESWVNHLASLLIS